MAKLASWLLLGGVLGGGLAGCGEVKDPNGLPDAPGAPTDGVPDGTGPAPGKVKITNLTFVGDGSPNLDAKIVVLDTAGAVVFDGSPNADGVVEVEMTGGSVHSVTLTEPAGTITRTGAVLSVYGVVPGDDITLGRRSIPSPTSGTDTTMSLEFTASTGTTYNFFTPCGATTAVTTSPAILTLRSGCAGARFPVLATATNPAAGPTYATQTATFAPGGTIFFVNGFSAMSAFSANVSGIPAEVSSLIVTRDTLLGNTAVSPQQVNFGDPTQTALAISLPYPPGVGPRSQVRAAIRRSDSVSTQTTEVRTANLGNSAEIAIGAPQLPWLTSVTLSNTGLSFVEGTPGIVPDGVVTQWASRFTAMDRQTTVVWLAYQRGIDAIEFPRLPAAYANIDSRNGTGVMPLLGNVLAYEYPEVADWNVFRQSPYAWSEVLFENVAGLVGRGAQRTFMTASAPRR